MTKKGKERCEWEYDEDGDFYHTSCDRDFCFIEGDLKDNNYFYCPGCGKPIKKGGRKEAAQALASSPDICIKPKAKDIVDIIDEYTGNSLPKVVVESIADKIMELLEGK
jgi:PHP family Zn ribbon phosphoesterase